MRSKGEVRRIRAKKKRYKIVIRFHDLTDDFYLLTELDGDIVMLF
jgi:hypothetical protein